MSLFQIDAGKEWRGGQRQSFLLAKEVQRRGFQFRFYVQPGSPLHHKSLKAGLPVFPIKMRSEMDIRAILRLTRDMRKFSCTLVHCHDAHSAALGAAAASITKVPVRVLSRRVDFPLKNNTLSRFKYRRNIDLIIAISQGVKKILVDGGVSPSRIRVIPSGIDFTPFEEPGSGDYLRKELSFSNKDYLVGIIAHLADHKGHKYLIKATKILKQNAPSIRIIVVGKGPLFMELNKLAKDTGVEDMVFFLGFREDIPQIMASLDLFVLSSYMEGMGSSILDAMASRLPVVATQVGGIPEVVINEETGLLVPPRNPSALARAILRVYTNRKWGSHLGQKGYELVHKKFSAEAMASKIIDAYEDLAKKKGISFLKNVGS